MYVLAQIECRCQCEQVYLLIGIEETLLYSKQGQQYENQITKGAFSNIRDAVGSFGTIPSWSLYID